MPTNKNSQPCLISTAKEVSAASRLRRAESTRPTDSGLSHRGTAVGANVIIYRVRRPRRTAFKIYVLTLN